MKKQPPGADAPLNVTQLRELLNTIASRADVLSRLAAQSAERLGDTNEAYVLYGLGSLADEIGMLADAGSGWSFRANQFEWAMGPRFSALGKGES
jgi:hypothetical protein